MNRKELREATSRRLGIPPTGDGLLTEPVLNECVNDALRDLSDVQIWPWLLTSASVTFTAGVAAQPTDPAVIQCQQLLIDGRRARKASSLAELLDSTVDGSRCVWFPVGTNVQLAPVPATAPTTSVLYYTQAEPPLDADSQSPLTPAQYHNYVIARAAYRAEVRRTRWEAAAQHNGEYEAGLKRMKDAARSTTGPRTIRPAGSVLWAVWA